MYFHNPKDREAKELVPGINAKTFWGEKMLAAVVDLIEYAGRLAPSTAVVPTATDANPDLVLFTTKEISRKDANRVYYRVSDSRTLRLIGMMREVFCSHG